MVEYYALVVDGDVFHTLVMDDSHPVAEKWIAALDSDLYFVKINNYSQVKPGFFYKNNNFYDKEDLENITPLEESFSEAIGENKYAGIVDNDVIGLMTLLEEDLGALRLEMVDAGMLSNPEIVKYTEDENVKSIAPGWVYDGANFYLSGEK